MGSIARWLGLQNIGLTMAVVRHNKGVMGVLYNWFRMDAFKHGKLIGVDKYGNKYFQNDYFFYGRNRWVEYNETVFLDYDSSQVPAEWHGWLHYICDDPPTLNPRVNYKWMGEGHRENLSGTDKAYVPFSTTRPKIQQWTPPGQDRIRIGSIK